MCVLCAWIWTSAQLRFNRISIRPRLYRNDFPQNMYYELQTIATTDVELRFTQSKCTHFLDLDNSPFSISDQWMYCVCACVIDVAFGLYSAVHSHRPDKLYQTQTWIILVEKIYDRFTDFGSFGCAAGLLRSLYSLSALYCGIKMLFWMLLAQIAILIRCWLRCRWRW